MRIDIRIRKWFNTDINFEKCYNSLKKKVKAFEKTNLEKAINNKEEELKVLKPKIIETNNIFLDKESTLEKIEELLEEQGKLTELKLDEKSSQFIPYAEKYLNKIKEVLNKIISREEINLLCQIQEELSNKKQELEKLENQIQKLELETKIEIPPK